MKNITWGNYHDPEYPEVEGAYNGIVASMGYEVLVTEEEGDYQGEALYLLRDGDRVGLLQSGWGLCSGCDALQACSSEKEVYDLRDEMHRSIEWHDSLDALRSHLPEHDWRWTDERLVERFRAAVATL